MDCNDINRRIRYALSLDDADMVDILRLSTYATDAATVSAWRLKEEEPGFVACPPEALHAFLDGLILQRRGAREDKVPPAMAIANEKLKAGHVVDNNEVLKQLRIALSLKMDEVQALITQGGGKLGKSEVNALFRKPQARNFRRCGDQVLRWFLAGLALRRNTLPQ